MTDHFVEVPKKVLSPTAEAVLRAAGDSEPGIYATITAALRALADQIVPSKQDYEEASHEFATVFLNGVAYAANEMRLIATELEGK